MTKPVLTLAELELFAHQAAAGLRATGSGKSAAAILAFAEEVARGIAEQNKDRTI